jgi:hypothetical protein
LLLEHRGSSARRTRAAMAGIEFSIFYKDRARNLWGTPTGFLYKLV